MNSSSSVSPNNRWRGSVRRGLSGAVVRPLNFTVSRTLGEVPLHA